MKTAELIDRALDWAVATCEGYEYNTTSGLLYKFKEPHFFRAYSTDWAQGGPIIEREKINLLYKPDMNCVTREIFPYWIASVVTHSVLGPTPLVAAMRCYVASKLGDEVEVPNELPNN